MPDQTNAIPATQIKVNIIERLDNYRFCLERFGKNFPPVNPSISDKRKFLFAPKIGKSTPTRSRDMYAIVYSVSQPNTNRQGGCVSWQKPIRNQPAAERAAQANHIT